MEPQTFESTLHELRKMLPYLLWGTLGLVAVFVLLMLVRLWGWRTQNRGGACGGIDLDVLRRQHLAGDVSTEEYEAVRRSVAGAAEKPATDATNASTCDTERPTEPPITPDGESGDRQTPESDSKTNTDVTPGDSPKRSKTDGEA